MEQENIKIQFDTNASDAANDVNKLGKSLNEVENSTNKAAGSSADLGKNLSELDTPINATIGGFKAMLVQMWAIVANPIGAILAAVVGVVALLGKAFFSTEENGKKFGKGIAVISGLFSGLMKILEPVASFLVDNIVKSFELAGQAILATSALLQKGLKAIGLAGAAEGLKMLTSAVEGNIKASGKLADAEAKLAKAQRNSEKIQLDYQKQAEKIRQQRDDETKSIAERVKLNNQLGIVLQKQLGAELSIAQQQLNVANLRIKQEGESTANLDARAEALTRISDIQERISGQESEQLANANSLRNEQKALNKEAADVAKAREDARKALRQEGLDAEKKLLQEIQDLNDESEEQQLARQKERAISEIEALKQKGIDVTNLLILNEEKYLTLEQELAEKRLEEQRLILEEENKQKAELDQKAKDEELERERALEQSKQEVRQAGVQNVENIGRNLQALAGKNKAVARAGLVVEGAVGVANIVSNTMQANAKALAAFPLTGGQPFTTINTVSGALSAATQIKAVATGLKAIGGGGVSAETPSFGGGRATAPPTVSFNNSAQNQIGQSVMNSQPIQVNVLESDISKAQSNVKVLENKNSF